MGAANLLCDAGDVCERADQLDRVSVNPDRGVEAGDCDAEPLGIWADAGDGGPRAPGQDGGRTVLRARTGPGVEGSRLDEHGRLRRDFRRGDPSYALQGTPHLGHVAVDPDQ